jgi:hypothetical protein
MRKPLSMEKKAKRQMTKSPASFQAFQNGKNSGYEKNVIKKMSIKPQVEQASQEVSVDAIPKTEISRQNADFIDMPAPMRNGIYSTRPRPIDQNKISLVVDSTTQYMNDWSVYTSKSSVKTSKSSSSNFKPSSILAKK